MRILRRNPTTDRRGMPNEEKLDTATTATVRIMNICSTGMHEIKPSTVPAGSALGRPRGKQLFQRLRLGRQELVEREGARIG